LTDKKAVHQRVFDFVCVRNRITFVKPDYFGELIADPHNATICYVAFDNVFEVLRAVGPCVGLFERGRPDVDIQLRVPARDVIRDDWIELAWIKQRKAGYKLRTVRIQPRVCWIQRELVRIEPLNLRVNPARIVGLSEGHAWCDREARNGSGRYGYLRLNVKTLHRRRRHKYRFAIDAFASFQRTKA